MNDALMRLVRDRRVELTLFVFALVVMGAALALAPSSLRPASGYNDYLSFYKPPAVNLLAGKGFVGLNGHPALHDPPGYPLILTVIYGIADVLHLGREGLVNVAIVIILALACVIVYRVGQAMFGHRVGVVAAVVWVTYPVELLMAPYRFSEVPFTPVLYLTALVFIDGAVRGMPSWRRMAVVGALIGVDALIRPQAILLVLPYGIALWVLSRRDRLQHEDAPASAAKARRRVLMRVCVVMVVAYVATIAPWEIWVKARTGHVIALSDGGPSAILNGLTVDYHPLDEKSHISLPSGVIALEQRVEAHQATLTSTGKIAHFMVSQLGAHPVDVLEMVGVKAAMAFYGTNSLTHETLIALVQLPYLALMIAGVVLAWRSGGFRRWLAVFVMATVAYMWVMTISVLSIVRYMGPVLGLLTPFAALALVRGWDALQSRRRARAAMQAGAA